MFFQLVECLAFLICAADSLLAAAARFAGPPPPKVLRYLTLVCTYVSIQMSRVGLHSLQFTPVCAFLFACFWVWPEPCMLHTTGGTSAQAVR
jgi:hypothetical protein